MLKRVNKNKTANTLAIKTLTLSILFILFIFSSPKEIGATPKYVGSKACGCHKAHYSDWKLSVHGRAYETLKPGNKKRAKLKANLDPDKDYTKDEKCLKCHTTGYRKNGGFKNIKKTPDRINVGCESCHGPASEYIFQHEGSSTAFNRGRAKAYGQTYGSENPAVCTKCHNRNRRGLGRGNGRKYEFHWEKSLKKRKAYHRKMIFHKEGIF